MLVTKNNQHVYVNFCLSSLICFWFSFIMGGISIASLNINGAREGKKRFQLLKWLNRKKLMFYLCRRLIAMS